jgi:hypothetical protein
MRFWTWADNQASAGDCAVTLCLQSDVQDRSAGAFSVKQEVAGML